MEHTTVAIAQAVARDQARFDAETEAVLLEERAHWDAAMAEVHARRMWEDGRRDLYRHEIMPISKTERCHDERKRLHAQDEREVWSSRRTPDDDNHPATPAVSRPRD
jgi:hypothetical protein